MGIKVADFTAAEVLALTLLSGNDFGMENPQVSPEIQPK